MFSVLKMLRFEAEQGAFRSLVHRSARRAPIEFARHRSFIASHILAGALAVIVFPIYFAFFAKATWAAGLAFVWFLSPLGIALYLSRTGRLDLAHFISAANLAGLVLFAAALTGGIHSFIVFWMLVVPLEAALSTNRRVLAYSVGMCVIALLGLYGATVANILPLAASPSFEPALLAFYGVLSAVIYAGGLAASVQMTYRQAERSIVASESRYRLLAEHATDMITRHKVDGVVTFCSPAARDLTGLAPDMLMGNDLFERVHVIDLKS